MAKSSSERLNLAFRREIKARIYNERGGKCAVCGAPLQDQSEMHEVFVTRGDVQSAPTDIQVTIHSTLNCVLVHPGTCHSEAQHTAAGKEKCAAEIVLYEGYSSVYRFLSALNEHMKGNQVEHEIRYLQELFPRLGVCKPAGQISKSWSGSM